MINDETNMYRLIKLSFIVDVPGMAEKIEKHLSRRQGEVTECLFGFATA